MHALLQHKSVYALFLTFLVLNVSLWFYARGFQAQWLNVPPVPSEFGASAMAIGDKQFAYRSLAIMLQNLGDTGGRTTNINEYDTQRLGQWFFLMDRLDPASNFVPLLAAYYFGAADAEKTDLRPIIDYLTKAGQNEGTEKWRWLAQAAYLARFKMNDLDLALEIAHKLASLDTDMPGWAYQMPAFVLNAKGEKEAAQAILLSLLQSSADELHPNEVYFTREYICTRLLTRAEAYGNPLCEDIPEHAYESAAKIK